MYTRAPAIAIDAHRWCCCCRPSRPRPATRQTRTAHAKQISAALQTLLFAHSDHLAGDTPAPSTVARHNTAVHSRGPLISPPVLASEAAGAHHHASAHHTQTIRSTHSCSHLSSCHRSNEFARTPQRLVAETIRRPPVPPTRPIICWHSHRRPHPPPWNASTARSARQTNHPHTPRTSPHAS